MRDTKTTKATSTEVRSKLANGSGNEPTPTAAGSMATGRNRKRSDDFEKLQDFLGSPDDLDDFCECLTHIERKYTDYVIGLAEEDDYRRSAISTLREIIERARKGFDLLSYVQFIEGRASEHAEKLRYIYVGYMYLLCGDAHFKGSADTTACLDLLDEFVDLLGEID